jgi:hypothetical protein
MNPYEDAEEAECMACAAALISPPAEALSCDDGDADRADVLNDDSDASYDGLYDPSILCSFSMHPLAPAHLRSQHQPMFDTVTRYEDALGWTLDYDAGIMAGGGDFTKAFHAAQSGQRYNRCAPHPIELVFR